MDNSWKFKSCWPLFMSSSTRVITLVTMLTMYYDIYFGCAVHSKDRSKKVVSSSIFTGALDLFRLIWIQPFYVISPTMSGDLSINSPFYCLCHFHPYYSWGIWQLLVFLKFYPHFIVIWQFSSLHYIEFCPTYLSRVISTDAMCLMSWH